MNVSPRTSLNWSDVRLSYVRMTIDSLIAPFPYRLKTNTSPKSHSSKREVMQRPMTWKKNPLLLSGKATMTQKLPRRVTSCSGSKATEPPDRPSLTWERAPLTMTRSQASQVAGVALRTTQRRRSWRWHKHRWWGRLREDGPKRSIKSSFKVSKICRTNLSRSNNPLDL